jgi:hypothetical protein
VSSGGLSIGELVGTVSLNDQFSGPVNGVAKALGLASESFTALAGAAGIVGGAVVGATSAIVALGVHGADVADVSSAFDQLTSAAGSTSEAMLGALQEGTLGTISNFDLMKASNGVLASGLVTSADNMRTLAAGAKLLADRTGGDTAQAFDTLTSAMATGRTQALKSLGVVVDSDTALKAYADSVHKTVPALSDHETAAAKAQAVLNGLKSALDANGPATVDFADRINQGKAAVQNFVDNVSVAIANSPALAVVMDTISGSIQSAFGGNNQAAIQTISDYVTKFGIFLVQTAEVGVGAARFITNAFEGSKVIFNAVLEALFSGIGSAAGTLADLADKAQALPVVGSAFATLAGDIHVTADMANSLAIGFGEMKEKAVDSAANVNAGFDAVQSVLGVVEDKMKALDGAQVQVQASSAGVRKGLDDVAAGAALTAAQMQAIEDATRKGQEAMADMASDAAAKFMRLQDDLTLANMTGVQARLFEIQRAQEAEIASLQGLAFAYPAVYEELTAMVTEKYGLMASAAIDAANQQVGAATGGAQGQIEQAQLALDAAVANYNSLASSGKATYAQLQAAHAKMTQAEMTLDQAKQAARMQQFQDLAQAASTILRSIFGKSKAAAIAAVIIDTAAGVVKSFAQYGWPWGLVPAAAITAQGFAAISKINSADGSFAAGTPDMSFVDFGRVSRVDLHGHEAVINPSQGETLQEMLVSAVASREQETAREIKGLRADMADRDRALPLWMRDAILFGNA